MKTQPVQPARLEFGADGVPFSAEYRDVYHARAGALAQAEHVFLGGNGLPARWRGRERFTVLELGFGLGNNFLATWDAWRRHADAGARLHYVAIERHPLTVDDLRRVHAASPLRALADALAAQWPSATPNLHRLVFDDARVQLTLAWFDVRDVLPELVLRYDACYLDGFAPAHNPEMWERRVVHALGRLAAPGATAATWSVARPLREALAESGFVVERAPGFGDKREMTVACWAPAFAPRSAPARTATAPPPRRVAIVGGGVAGCAMAWALAEQGISSTIFERHAAPAREASGNPAGLFHGVVTAVDGPHARWGRAAALQAAPLARRAIAVHGAPGGVDGVLRLESGGADALAAMRATLAAQALAPDVIDALDGAEASRRAGLALRDAAWWHPQGGWIEPAALCASLLRDAGAAVDWRGGVAVHALADDDTQWCVLGADCAVLDRVDAVVLADNADPSRWIGGAAWPLQRVRGQITALAAEAWPHAQVRVPIAGGGYLLPPLAGRLWCGATNEPDARGDDAQPRADADAANLVRLRQMLGDAVAPTARDAIAARVGWRCIAADRLPLIGALPDACAAAQAARLDQPRFVPRLRGLHVVTALASRGIASAPLAARTAAALIAGTPCPVESSLLDAVDAARFVSRRARRDGITRG
jgi:tRNA 5-methylaminomethyl-2-thiouridine biosynthesis bifunctional protein